MDTRLATHLDQPQHQQYKPALERLQAALTMGDDAAAQAADAEIQALQAQHKAYLASTPALLNSALWYATSLGWPVFPLHPGGKTPATRHGFKDATTSPDQIRAWWHTNPEANIGLPTGIGFDVVDIDKAGAYRDHILPLRHKKQFPALVAYAFTPRGRHLYIPAAGESNGVNLYPGIDYRGAGGYVVAPPSRLASGGQYRWHQPPGGDRLYP